MVRFILKIILIFVIFSCSSCSLHENLRCDGPSDTDAHQWAGLNQDSQLAMPMGGTWLFIVNAWHYHFVVPPGELWTKQEQRDIDAGPMALWANIVFFGGGIVTLGGTFVGDLATLPVTIP